MNGKKLSLNTPHCRPIIDDDTCIDIDVSHWKYAEGKMYVAGSIEEVSVSSHTRVIKHIMVINGHL